MGTKLKPGPFDCYAKLFPDEPYLTLRGKDVSAPYLIMAWVKSRQGDWAGVLEIVQAMVIDPEVQRRVSTDANPKLEEALNTAFAMRDWRKLHESKVQTHGDNVQRGIDNSDPGESPDPGRIT